jgi:hypothetical protein
MAPPIMQRVGDMWSPDGRRSHGSGTGVGLQSWFARFQGRTGAAYPSNGFKDGRSVPTPDAVQLRNWAINPDDAVLPPEDIARSILSNERDLQDG